MQASCRISNMHRWANSTNNGAWDVEFDLFGDRGWWMQGTLFDEYIENARHALWLFPWNVTDWQEFTYLAWWKKLALVTKLSDVILAPAPLWPWSHAPSYEFTPSWYWYDESLYFHVIYHLICPNPLAVWVILRVGNMDKLLSGKNDVVGSRQSLAVDWRGARLMRHWFLFMSIRSVIYSKGLIEYRTMNTVISVSWYLIYRVMSDTGHFLFCLTG